MGMAYRFQPKTIYLLMSFVRFHNFWISTLYSYLTLVEIPSGLLDKTAGSRHNITLLSAVMGLRNAGSYYDKLTKGIRSPVTVNNKDITQGDWFHGVGLQGERDGYFNRGSNLNWQTAIGAKLSLIWYKIILPRAQIQSLLQKSESKSFVSFALDLSSMGKGAAWVNGHSIGRYWDVKSDASLCKPCSPSGAFFDKKCLTKCGEASQEYYHVPKDWLLSESGDVELVLFEEFGGDPSAIELVMLM